MENTKWSKTILTVYRYLKRMTFAFDRMIKSKAYNSFYTTSENFAFNNIFDISNSILDLSERKVTLINLKILTERVLKSIDRDLAKILIFKYVDNKKCEEISSMLGCTTRTYFRKINLAHKSFYKALTRLGYDEEKLEQMLKNEKWILNVYKDFCDEESQIIEAESKLFLERLKRNIYFELKKVSCF